MKYLVVLVVMLTLSACGKKHSHDGDATAPAVELDNGKKWKADESTNAGIQTLHSVLSDFRSSVKSPGLPDYHRLHADLQSHLDATLKSCTMSGEGHRQLHNYLGTVVKSLLTLEGDDDAASVDELRTLDAHLLKYRDYFE